MLGFMRPGTYPTGWKTLMLAVVIVGGGLGGAILLAAWYLVGGGLEAQTRRHLAELAECDPAAEARRAIAGQDYRLWSIYRHGEFVVPGLGQLNRDNEEGFTFRTLHLIKKLDLTPEEIALNEKALRKAAAYNKIVYRHVKKTAPD